MANTTLDKMRALTANTSTGVLISALVKLNRDDCNEDERLTRAIITEEIERRFPKVEQEMNRIFSDESEAGLNFICEHSFAEILLAVLSGQGVIR